MAEMFGITVLDDSVADAQSDCLGVGITAIVRIKHAALYEAAKVMGSASALARHLGVSPTEIGEWINLKSCPPREPSDKMPSWTDERIAIMEAKLMELTGKTWEELWPDELRENHSFLNAPKSIEKVFNWKQSAMLQYAEATRSRLIAQSGGNAHQLHDDSEVKLNAIRDCLHMLTSREREVISMRFGFNGAPKTFEEVGVLLKITRERVRQIELRALSRIKYYAGLSLISENANNAKIDTSCHLNGANAIS